MRHVRALAPLAAIALAACGGPPSLAVEVVFADDAQRDASAAIEIVFHAGDCEGGEVLWRSVVREGEQPVDLPPTLMRGRGYCIEAIARDASCAVTARASASSADAPAGLLTLTLEPFSAGPTDCGSAACIDGVCAEACEEEGAACLSSGAPGVCRQGACCAGCWTGEACLPGVPAAELDTGELFTCVRGIDGRIACWGSHGQGELGDGTRGGTTGPTWRANARPIAVPAETRFVSLTTGIASGYAVDADGALWVWGWNADGQLGLGESAIGVNALTPVELPHPLGAAWDRVEAPKIHLGLADPHACAFSQDGELWCWGANADGQVDPTQPAGARDAIVAAPRRVEGTFSHVALAHRATCAVVTGTARVTCWGNNEQGMLGTGDAAPRDGAVMVSLPSGAANIVEIAAAMDGFCVRTEDDRVFCWGDGASTSLPVPTATPVRAIQAATAIEAAIATSAEPERLALGRMHGAAITGDSPLVWGFNRDGNLALGADAVGETLPPQPSGAIPSPASVVREVGVGSYHSCVRLDDGTIACAGSNAFGQIGVPVTRPIESAWARFCPCPSCGS